MSVTRADAQLARAGQVCVEVSCRCSGTVLVRVDAVGSWRCSACRSRAIPNSRTVTLGPGGALPANWRDRLVGAAA